jgi:hypothetical protein
MGSLYKQKKSCITSSTLKMYYRRRREEGKGEET